MRKAKCWQRQRIRQAVIWNWIGTKCLIASQLSLNFVFAAHQPLSEDLRHRTNFSLEFGDECTIRLNIRFLMCCTFYWWCRRPQIVLSKNYVNETSLSGKNFHWRINRRSTIFFPNNVQVFSLENFIVELILFDYKNELDQ